MFKSTNLLFFFLFLLLFILYFSSCLFGVCCYCFVFVYFETRCLCTALAGLELTILLPQSSECWDYKCVPPHLASFCFLIFLEWIHFMIPLYWLIIFKIILNINGLIKVLRFSDCILKVWFNYILSIKQQQQNSQL
jgi:hypothetical protein